MKFETLAIHAGQGPDPAYGAVMQPIYQVSTFAYKGVKQMGPFDYSRNGNPPARPLRTASPRLRRQPRVRLRNGMAAETTALALLESGDHIIVHDDLCGGTYRLLTSVVARRV